jgi:hypothetical protein
VSFEEANDGGFRMWANEGCWPEYDSETDDEIDFFSLVREHLAPGSHMLIYSVGFDQGASGNHFGIGMGIEALHRDGRSILLEPDQTMADRIKNAGW